MKRERRAVARYRDNLPVEINIGGHAYKDAVTMDISSAGLRISCEGGLARSVFSKHIQITPGDNLSVSLVIRVKKDLGIVNNVYCDAIVISVNRVSQSRYDVGLKFLQFKDDSKVIWDEYIATKN